ncbi:MAG: DUF6541 family protein [Candidatus Woesearchaeota archaeon]
MKSKHIHILLITILYLFTIFTWTQPIRTNEIPFGQVDASSHFTVADYTSSYDQPITDLPKYIYYRYGLDNTYKENTLWYHPPYHLNLALIQIFTNSRFLSFYIFIAILCSLVVLINYFIINRWYGFWHAFLSSVLVAFAGRNVLVYLFGQWPERISYFFTPIIIYLFYMYFINYKKKEEKTIYMYLLAILLAINLLLHPMGFFHSIAALAIIYLLLALKEKKIFIINLKTLILPIITFLIIIAIFPYQTGNVIKSFQGSPSIEGTSGDISRLFSWFKKPDNLGGVPEIYFSFADMNGIWIIPLILIGIIFLVLRRKTQDIFMLGWLISLYIVIHADVIGKGPFVHRSLAASNMVFAPLAAIGILAIISFIPLAKQKRQIVKYGLITAFIILAIIYNIIPSISMLNTFYESPLSRLNPFQFEVSQWLTANTDKDDVILDLGTSSLAKQRWMQYISQRHFNGINIEELEQGIPNTHVIYDYSDLVLMGDRNTFDQLVSNEQQNFNNSQPIYNKENIRVYRIEN